MERPQPHPGEVRGKVLAAAVSPGKNTVSLLRPLRILRARRPA
jgi:hypothetical protein